MLLLAVEKVVDLDLGSIVGDTVGEMLHDHGIFVDERLRRPAGRRPFEHVVQ